MEADKLVTCFETSQKLKEAGFPQNKKDKSYFVWAKPPSVKEWQLTERNKLPIHPAYYETIAAFTTDELLMELPICKDGEHQFTYWLEIHKNGKCCFPLWGFSVNYFCDDKKSKRLLFDDIDDESLLEALAQLCLKVKGSKRRIL